MARAFPRVAVWLAACLLLTAGAAMADTTIDVPEGGVVDLSSVAPVVAGDVVLCEPGTTCDGSSTTNWSDVAVFTTNSVQVFSADTDNLSGFVGNLSVNVTFLIESATGPTLWDPLNGPVTYAFDSPASGGGGNGVPEPSTLLLSALGLGGLALKRFYA